MWSVLEGTQRVPPTCTTKTAFTYCCFCRGSCHSCSHSTRIQSRCDGCRGQTCARNQCRNRRRRRSCCVPCNPPLQTGRVGSGKLYLKISKIEKNVSLDHTRPCIQTYNKNIKIYPRINSTFKVIRACIFIMLSVREVTQRVPPTCTIKTSRTGGRGKCGWLPTHGTTCAKSTVGIGQRRRTNMCWTFDERGRKKSRFDRWVVFPRLPNNVCRRIPNHGCWSIRPHTVP